MKTDRERLTELRNDLRELIGRGEAVIDEIEDSVDEYGEASTIDDQRLAIRDWEEAVAEIEKKCGPGFQGSADGKERQLRNELLKLIELGEAVLDEVHLTGAGMSRADMQRAIGGWRVAVARIERKHGPKEPDNDR